MSSTVIAGRNLSKSYSGTVAVDDLSFDVTSGTVTGFLGPNGAGKSTTIRMLLGLARPDSGKATLFGKEYEQLDRPWTAVGAVIDGAGFHPLRSAHNHLRAVAASGRIPLRRTDDVLAIMELTDAAGRKVGEFSLGMRQRLGLAAALLGEPAMLILDEPANGLDPAGIHWLRQFLRSFAAEGGTVFVSSHLLAEVAQIADEVVVINRGRLITHTNVRSLTAATSVKVRVSDSGVLRRALACERATVTDLDGGALEVVGMTSERVGETAAREQLIVYELTPRVHTLEEVFLELIGTNGKEA
jgi:ABC-2 type transport system ATP-binding protein